MKLTENWFAKTGFSSHILGNSCKRWNSPLKLLPMLPALEISLTITKAMHVVDTNNQILFWDTQIKQTLDGILMWL